MTSISEDCPLPSSESQGQLATEMEELVKPLLEEMVKVKEMVMVNGGYGMRDQTNLIAAFADAVVGFKAHIRALTAKNADPTKQSSKGFPLPGSRNGLSGGDSGPVMPPTKRFKDWTHPVSPYPTIFQQGRLLSQTLATYFGLETLCSLCSVSQGCRDFVTQHSLIQFGLNSRYVLNLRNNAEALSTAPDIVRKLKAAQGAGLVSRGSILNATRDQWHRYKWKGETEDVAEYPDGRLAFIYSDTAQFTKAANELPEGVNPSYLVTLRGGAKGKLVVSSGRTLYHSFWVQAAGSQGDTRSKSSRYQPNKETKVEWKRWKRDETGRLVETGEMKDVKGGEVNLDEKRDIDIPVSDLMAVHSEENQPDILAVYGPTGPTDPRPYRWRPDRLDIQLIRGNEWVQPSNKLPDQDHESFIYKPKVLRLIPTSKALFLLVASENAIYIWRIQTNPSLMADLVYPNHRDKKSSKFPWSPCYFYYNHSDNASEMSRSDGEERMCPAWARSDGGLELTWPLYAIDSPYKERSSFDLAEPVDWKRTRLFQFLHLRLDHNGAVLLECTDPVPPAPLAGALPPLSFAVEEEKLVMGLGRAFLAILLKQKPAGEQTQTQRRREDGDIQEKVLLYRGTGGGGPWHHILTFNKDPNTTINGVVFRNGLGSLASGDALLSSANSETVNGNNGKIGTTRYRFIGLPSEKSQ